jgi:hypothetical protein
MNERIHELAEQATVSISYRVCQHTFKEIDGPAGPFVRKEFSKEKFAELIVRECVDLFDDDPQSGTRYSPQACRSMIMEYFGVE